MSLMLSIDSVSRENYEGIRRGASFDRLIENLSLIGEAGGLGIAVNTVVMKRNMHELQLLPDFCRRFRAGSLRFSALNGDRIIEEDVFRDPSLVKDLGSILTKVEGRCRQLGMRFSADFKAFMNTRASSGPRSPDNWPGKTGHNRSGAIGPGSI